jgi:site-specific recombinase XerD
MNNIAITRAHTIRHRARKTGESKLMASLYKKPVVKTDPKTGKKIRGKSTKWWGRFRDALGIEKRVPLAKDKSAAQSMLNELVKKVELEKAGRLDPFEAHAKRPLSEHVNEFAASLRDKGTGARHIKDVTAKIRRTVAECGFQLVSDLSATQVQAYLADLRRNGLSAQTSNHYLRANKQFSRWLVRDRRIADDPLAYLAMVNVQLDRRHDRRALSPDEFARLVYAAQTGKPIESILGPDRAMMYVLSAWTGYRKGEIGSLTRRSLKLNDDPPTAIVAAAYSKRKRQDAQVLHPDVVTRLKEWLDTKTELGADDLLFPVSGKVPGGIERKTSKMMQRDLDSARAEWIAETASKTERKDRKASDFLAYRDHEGRFADFHSNRHTFITSLCRSQVSPKTAQTLARHSDIRLTMGTYSHIELSEQQDAIESLPGLVDRSNSADSAAPEPANAGDKMVPILVPSGAENGANQLAAKPPQSSSDCIRKPTKPAPRDETPVRSNHRRQRNLRRVTAAPASSCGSGIESEEEGTPGRIRTCGLRFRKPSLYPTELRGQTLEIKG